MALPAALPGSGLLAVGFASPPFCLLSLRPGVFSLAGSLAPASLFSLLASLVVWAGISGDPRLTLSFVVSPPFLEEFASARFTPCNLNFKFSVMSSLIQVSHFI